MTGQHCLPNEKDAIHQVYLKCSATQYIRSYIWYLYIHTYSICIFVDNMCIHIYYFIDTYIYIAYI